MSRPDALQRGLIDFLGFIDFLGGFDCQKIQNYPKRKELELNCVLLLSSKSLKMSTSRLMDEKANELEE